MAPGGGGAPGIALRQSLMEGQPVGPDTFRIMRSLGKLPGLLPEGSHPDNRLMQVSAC